MVDRILVTGGLGFVGSAVVEQLLTAGHSVTVFDDASRGKPENVDLDAVTLVRGDIRDQEAIAGAIGSAGVGAVIHLAAMHFIPDCNRDPQGCITTNVVGTENVLAACERHGVDTVVAASSMAVYPIADGPSSETDPVGPYDVYGETKVANEMQLGRWSRRGPDRTAVAIRLSNAYGPRETNPHVIPAIMEQLRTGATDLDLGNTAPLRDYVHTSDIAVALEKLAYAALPPGFHVFNLGSGEERSVDQILADLSQLLGRPIGVRVNPEKVRPVERMHLLPDISRLSAAVGWRPQVPFRDGIARLARWYGLETVDAADEPGLPAARSAR